MMMSWLTIFTVSFAVLSTLIIADDPCKFTLQGKGTIDLVSIGRTDGTAAFPDKVPATGSNYKYSYNPCKPFTEGPCQNAAACQVSMDEKFKFKLGSQESAVWTATGALGNIPTISYNEGDKKVIVSLQCGVSTIVPEFEALGEDPINTYKFKLTSKCCCWDGCTDSPPQPGTSTRSPGGGGGGIGGGAVFIIILLVVAFVYFVGFALFFHFHAQKSGKDLIAHRTFWVALPVYAKDGVVYIYRRATGKGDAPYQSV